MPIIWLTHWDSSIYVSSVTIISSDNGLLPGRHQTIIWTSAGVLLIGPLGTNFSEIVVATHTFSFRKMHLKMLSGKWRPFSRPHCVNTNSKSKSWHGECCLIVIVGNMMLSLLPIITRKSQWLISRRLMDDDITGTLKSWVTFGHTPHKHILWDYMAIS